MATPTDKENKDSLDNINKVNEAAKALAATYKQIERSTGILTSNQKEALDISKSLSNVASNIEKSINLRINGEAKSKDIQKQIKILTQDQLNKNGELNKLGVEYSKQLDIARTLRAQQAKLTQEQIAAEEALGQKASRVANLQSTIRTYQEQIIAAQGRGDRNEAARLTNLKRRAALLLSDAKQNEKDAKDDLKAKEKQLVAAKKLTDEAKEQAKALAASKIAYAAAVEAQNKELEALKKANMIAKGKEVLNAANEQFNVKQIKDMFTLQGIFKMILEAAINYNKISVNIGKNFGYGAAQADRVATSLLMVAQNSSNLNVTLKSASEAMNQLNDQTGFVAEYSADALETQVMLTKQFGLQADEAAGIYKLSVLTGKSSEDVNKSMVSAFVNMRNQLKVGIPFKATMAEAAKVSGQLAANLKNNPEYIVNAVSQAKALGTTLEQTKRQGESLLDFESSIENELKAELLTGQALNLERARAAALMGDQVTVMQELNNQGMTLEKFQNMNVLAQKSFAAAIGLSSDELANQLRQQKLAEESGKSLAQITEEEAIEAQKRQNIQDKFNTAIEKLQDIVGNLVAGPFGQLLEYLAKSLDLVSKIIVSLGPLGPILTGAAAGFAVGGPVGALVGAGIGLAGSISNEITAKTPTKKADDMVGYGARTLITPTGNVALNNNDTIIAGTNLFKGDDVISTGKGGINLSPDMSPVVNALNDLKTVFVQKNFSPVLKADGTTLATVTAQSSYNLA